VHACTYASSCVYGNVGQRALARARLFANRRKVDGNSSLRETATIVLSFTVAVRCEMSAAEMRTCNSVSRSANRRPLVSERYTVCWLHCVASRSVKRDWQQRDRVIKVFGLHSVFFSKLKIKWDTGDNQHAATRTNRKIETFFQRWQRVTWNFRESASENFAQLTRRKLKSMRIRQSGSQAREPTMQNTRSSMLQDVARRFAELQLSCFCS